VVVGGKETVYTLAALKKTLKPRTITLATPLYPEARTFDAFGLDEVLALAGLAPGARGDEIVFTAADGYSPNTSFETLKAHPAVLVFQEHGKRPGTFTPVAQGKELVNPAPFVLGWTEGKELGEQVPWPYQLVRIEVVRFAEKYDRIFPQDQAADSKVMRGFMTFKDQCIRCHSVNLQGGVLGPELNAPRNITEYWDRAVLREYIRDAGAFRYKDKMPAFPRLTEGDLDELLEYLGYMKLHKIKL
jgi:mono/diheme cytochrome c family protein